MTTRHIEVCRKAWHAHRETCPECSFASWNFCPRGENLYDELCHAITAHKDCQHIIATEPKEPQGCDPIITK